MLDWGWELALSSAEFEKHVKRSQVTLLDLFLITTDQSGNDKIVPNRLPVLKGFQMPMKHKVHFVYSSN